MTRYITLAAALAALFVVFGYSYAFAPTQRAGSRMIVVEHSRWIARCEALPVDAVSDIEIESVRTGQGRITAVLTKGRYLGYLTADRLGVYLGIPVYSVIGPTVLRDRMASDPACPQVKTYQDLATLGPVARDWIAERSTCCGEATVNGRTYHAWPCRWSIDRPAEITVTRIDGIGPGVVGSRGACVDYRQNRP